MDQNVTEAARAVEARPEHKKTLVDLQSIGKTYHRDKEPIPVLENINLQIPEGSFEALNQEFNKTILMVTHDPHAAQRAGMTRRLDKGTLSS